MTPKKTGFIILLFVAPIIVLLFLIYRAPQRLRLQSSEKAQRLIVEQKPTVSKWAAGDFDPIEDSPAFFQKLETIEAKNSGLLTSTQSQRLYETLRNYLMAYHLGTFEAYARFRVPVVDFELAPSVLQFLTGELKKENQPIPSGGVDLLSLYWQRYVQDKWKNFWTGVSLPRSFVEIQTVTKAIPSLKDYIFERENLGVASSGPIVQFRLTPDAILKEKSNVCYATVSLLIRNTDVTCPVYCRFYWAEKYNKWLPLEQYTAYAGPRKQTLLF